MVHAAAPTHEHDHAHSSEGAVTDPVCGMKVDPASARRVEHEGRVFHFCSARCRTKFEAGPARYLAPAPVPEPAPAGTIYTCPMHPEIRQVGPGSCPICGMALEPVSVTAEAGPNPELLDMARRFWIGLVLAIPIVALEMGGHIPGFDLHHWFSPRLSILVQLVLATPVVLWAGLPFFARGWASLVNRSLNMFSLIALGTGAAYLYSVVAALVPDVFPAGFRRDDGSVPVYFEAAAVITVLVLLGQVLELRAREQTGGAIRALLNLAPKTARRIRADGSDEEVTLDKINVGDRLRIRPGDGVPLDGEVLEGKSAVDESMVTGESLPVEKQSGSKLIGGTVNGTGALVMRVEKVGTRHHAGAYRRHGGGSPALARADPAPGRSGGGMVRAGGRRHRCARFHRLGRVGAAAGAYLRSRCGGVGRHYCLPLCARARDADVDHGWRRQGGRGGRAH